MDYVEKWGQDEEDAINLALADLKLTREEVDVIVLEESSKGFLGFGKKLAKVRVQKKASSVLITRDERVDNGVICKIVDFYGVESDLGKITAALDRLMVERDYEFIDIYSYGVPTELYEQAGFCYCDEASENIIPNYFHPFERRNITLRMIDPMVPEMRLFRGDGDQDRPC